MVSLLVIADDFTGALDTGVQFVKNGVSARVALGYAPEIFSSDVQVLVVNTESRHLSPSQARERVFRLAASASRAGVSHIYKKTDSALRGNIGAELEALSDACGHRPVYFFPAFPSMGRTTRGGVQHIHGVPANRSEFALDPFDPVSGPTIPAIVAEQSDMPVTVLAVGQTPAETAGGLLVFDAETDGDLAALCRFLGPKPPFLTAGCAGFAALLPELLGLRRGDLAPVSVPRKMAVLSGSVTPLTFRQIACAKTAGFPCIEPSLELKLASEKNLSRLSALSEELEAALQQEGRLLLVASENGESVMRCDEVARDEGLSSLETGRRIADFMGDVGAAFSKRHPDVLMFVIGGDTLAAYLRCMDTREILPVGEPLPGVVLTRIACPEGLRHVLTKSGGFGEGDVIPKIFRMLPGAGKDL